MRFVLDNSVAMRWLFRDGSDTDIAYADAILRLLEQPRSQALAPSILLLEACNVVVRAESRGWISEAEGREYSYLLEHMAIRIDDQPPGAAFGYVVDLARRFDLSTYDAAYLELALREGAPLATLDRRLQEAAEKTGAAIMTG